MKAKLHLQLRNPEGEVVCSRRASNTVMQGGAQLIADLFSGSGTAITHMGVGTNDEDPDDVLVESLTNAATGESEPLDGATEGAIAADAFSSTVIPDRRVVQVRVRGTLPDDAAVGLIREAGLLAGSGDSAVLYNRVVFAPIDKRDDHELTLFWEVEFPFGDIQWLT
jgi:hypothetical protein